MLDRLALALEFLGALRNDQRHLDRAIDLYKTLGERDDLNPRGKAHVLKRLGDTYRYKAAWSEAREAYRAAQNAHALPIVEVFLSECLLQLEGWRHAADRLGSIDPGQLEKGEYVDFVFTLAAVALASGEKPRLRDSERLLRSLEVPHPYFRALRDDLLLNVIDAQRLGKPGAAVKRVLVGIGGLASRYLKLEPTFMGVGVNVGQMLKDISQGEDEHSKGRGKRGDRDR